MESRQIMRKKRQKRIRAVISGDKLRPRLAVYRSNTYLYASLIDDVARVTLISVKGAGKNIAAATALGETLAQKAKKKGIERVVFDRGGFRYHGSVQALADSARKGGLKF